MSRYLVERINSASNIELRYRNEVVAGRGDGHLERLTIADRDSRACPAELSHWL
jgi:thioredoxin reductase (NADPH)